MDEPEVYARWRGKIEYYCPACGWLNTEIAGPRGPWTYECKRNTCQRMWEFGIVIRKTKRGGPRRPPRDTIFPPTRRYMEAWGLRDPANVNETGLPMLKPRRERMAELESTSDTDPDVESTSDLADDTDDSE